MRTAIRFLTALMALSVVACTAGSAPSPTSTTTAVSVPLSAVATSTTTTTTTTTTPPTTAPEQVTTTLPDDGPVLDDGRPATFLAVTDRGEAVEVDTVTGQVLRSLGHAADPTLDDGSEMPPNVLDGVWRTRDGSTFVFSVCCEPAAGAITVLDRASLPFSPETPPGVFSWWAAPGPDGSMAYGGYTIAAGDPAAPETLVADTVYAAGVAWIGATTVAWIEGTDGAAGIGTVDVTGGERGMFEVPSFTEWRPAGLAVDGAGTPYTVRSTDDVLVEVAADGTVTTPGVDHVARLGTFDASGRFLIFVDDDGAVRWWTPTGGAGRLGQGYVFASW